MNIRVTVSKMLYRRDPVTSAGFDNAMRNISFPDNGDTELQRSIISNYLISHLANHPVCSLSTVSLLQTKDIRIWIDQFDKEVADVICNLALF